MAICGYLSLLSGTVLRVLVLVLNRFSKHNAAFAEGHACVCILLPSEKYYFRETMRLFLLFGLIKRICCDQKMKTAGRDSIY